MNEVISHFQNKNCLYKDKGRLSRQAQAGTIPPKIIYDFTIEQHKA